MPSRSPGSADPPSTARTGHLPSLRALELFVAVVDRGGLGAGARQVGMYQPNASRMIAQLEAEAGRALLDRSPRGSRPTTAGRAYADRARELLAAAHDFGRFAQGAEGQAPELRLGASLTIAEHLLPAWLTQLRQLHPRARVDLHVQNSTQVLDRIRDGELQLGFVETPHLPGGINCLPLREDELVVVVAPDHPWGRRRDPLTLEELAATPLVVREGGSGTRDAFVELVPDAAATPAVQELGSNAAVRIAVASGAGPAVLSMLAVRSQIESGQLQRVPVRGGLLRRSLTAVWIGARQLRGPAADLVSIARQCDSAR